MQTDVREGDRIPMQWEVYLELPEAVRGEYIDGCLVVSPPPTQRHQIICGNLVTILSAQLPARRVPDSGRLAAYLVSSW